MRATTSSSILSKELLKRKRKYLVYTHNDHGQLISVSVCAQTSTVQGAIDQAIAEFQKQYGLIFEEKQVVRLYAANSNGIRVKEYPSLDQEQPLSLINLHQFYLRQSKRTNSPTTRPLHRSTIMSGFDDGWKRKERKAGRQMGCMSFCF